MRERLRAVKFRKRPSTIEAFQWFKNGDHPQDDPFRAFEDTGEFPTEPREGKVVRYFRLPQIQGEHICEKCGVRFHEHGFIDNPEVGITVCPKDWVITMDDGRYFAMKPDIFSATFEPDCDISHLHGT